VLSEKTTFCFWRSNLEHRVKIKMKLLCFIKIRRNEESWMKKTLDVSDRV
jgi:hypothetical protein